MKKGTNKSDAKRIEAVLKELKITKYRLAQDMGFVGAATIYKVANGSIKLTPKLAAKIVTAHPVINYNYLIGRESKILADKDAQIIQSNILKSKSVSEHQELVEKLDLVLFKLNRIENHLGIKEE